MKEILGIRANNFIVDAVLEQDGDEQFYTLKFADKSTQSFERTAANVTRIEELIGQQVKSGKEFYCNLERNPKNGFIMGAAADICSSAITGVGVYQATGDVRSAVCAGGTVGLVGFAAIFRSYYKLRAIQAFLETTKERSDLAGDIDTFLRQAPNLSYVLDGATPRGRERRASKICGLMEEGIIRPSSVLAGWTREGLTPSEFGRAKAEVERLKVLKLTLAHPSFFQKCSKQQ